MNELGARATAVRGLVRPIESTTRLAFKRKISMSRDAFRTVHKQGSALQILGPPPRLDRWSAVRALDSYSHNSHNIANTILTSVFLKPR